MKSLAHLPQIRRPSWEIKFRVVELKTLRFSTAIGLNLYAEDRVEYFSVFLVASVAALLKLNSITRTRPDPHGLCLVGSGPVGSV